MISREECPFSSLAPSRSSKSAAVPVQLLNNFSNCLFYFGQFVVHFSNLKRNSRRMCCRVIRQWCTISLFFALMVDTTPLKNPTKDQICRGEYVTLFLSYVRSIRLRLGRQKKSRSAVECSIFAVVGYIWLILALFSLNRLTLTLCDMKHVGKIFKQEGYCSSKHTYTRLMGASFFARMFAWSW